jgi:YHS domain-containing protein
MGQTLHGLYQNGEHTLQAQLPAPSRTNLVFLPEMAHQTNVHTVHQTFEPTDPQQKVKDPVCGKDIERRASKNMVFRGDKTHYFCSRACEEEFLNPARHLKSAV